MLLEQPEKRDQLTLADEISNYIDEASKWADFEGTHWQNLLAWSIQLLEEIENEKDYQEIFK